MADVIRVEGVDRAEAHFRLMGRRSVPAARTAALQAGFLLNAYVKQNMLSGQRLRVRSDELRSSFNVRQAPEVGDGVGAIVGTNVRYAPVHEFGFSGDVRVGAHPREIRVKPKKAPRRAPRAPRAGTKSRPRTETRIVQVRAHSRHVNLRARRYLRDTVSYEGQRALALASRVYLRLVGGA